MEDQNQTTIKVRGQAVLELPQDLYIPPSALQVFLEAFEGPLDLLLYLIKKQNLDILDIPVLTITQQYMEYIELMTELQFELAAEYLVMAAMLAEIKSRMLLPRVTIDEEEVDPRAELVRRLQEYERYKKAAEDLDTLPRRERDTFEAAAKVNFTEVEPEWPEVEFLELLSAFKDVLSRMDLRQSHHIQREALSVRERMSLVLERLQGQDFLPFYALFTYGEGREGLVVAFIATLELLRNGMIEIVQAELFGPIHIRAVMTYDGN